MENSRADLSTSHRKDKSSYSYFIPSRNFAFHYLLSLAKRKGWENPTLSYKMLIADKNITFKSMKVNKLFYFIVLIFFYKLFGRNLVGYNENPCKSRVFNLI